MIVRVEPEAKALDSALGRTSPLAKLAVAVVWLGGLALTTAVGPPLVLAAVALGAGLAIGFVRPAALARGLAPLWLAALAVGLFNAVFTPRTPTSPCRR
jgi:hypothetical protein